MHKARQLTMVALAVEIALALAYAQDDGTLLERDAEASAIVQSSPRSALTLDTASLTNAWKESGISVYRCTALFQDFGKSVTEANGNAAAKRAQLDAATWKLLETGMAKAQAAGNLDLHLAYRAAFDSGLETLKGDNDEIVKIRTARAKRLAQIDADLRAAGVTAAHTLHASLEFQKAELTKKGDIDTAVKVVGFQQKVAEWGKNPQTSGQAAAIVSATAERPAAPSRPQLRPQSPISNASRLESAKSAYCVIDLSAGANALSYPVSYHSAPPPGGFNTDEYKMTKLVLKRIEAGTFIMGGAAKTTLSKPFYIGLFEVTQKQWSLVTGDNPSRFSGDKRPVEMVSYNAIRGLSEGAQWPASSAVDSSSFLGKLRARTGLDFDLPTEAQWEYACRAGTTTTYSYGNSPDGNYMWFKDNSLSQTHEVGTKKPNPWGLYDMHGNVWEWCRDWYADNPSGGSNPQGFSSGSSRVLRGGSKYRDASYCTSSNRGDNSPSRKDRDDFGFRLAMIISK